MKLVTIVVFRPKNPQQILWITLQVTGSQFREYWYEYNMHTEGMNWHVTADCLYFVRSLHTIMWNLWLVARYKHSKCNGEVTAVRWNQHLLWYQYQFSCYVQQASISSPGLHVWRSVSDAVSCTLLLLGVTAVRSFLYLLVPHKLLLTTYCSC